MLFKEFYGMYEPEEQEVIALINRCIGGGYNNRGDFWEMTVVTLGMVFCDTGKVSTKEERLEWPVTDEERDGEKGWGRFQKEQVCRLRIRRMKEEWAKDLIVRPWCISEVIEAREDCPELQAVLDEYHRPVVIQDEVLGELTLDKDFGSFEGEVRWCGKDVLLYLEVNAERKSSWTRARSAAKNLLAEQGDAGACGKEPDRAGQRMAIPGWGEPPQPGNRSHHGRGTCAADQHGQPVRHLRRQLHRLVRLRRDVHRPCGDGLRLLEKGPQNCQY